MGATRPARQWRAPWRQPVRRSFSWALPIRGSRIWANRCLAGHSWRGESLHSISPTRQSVADVAGEIAHRVDILDQHNAKHPRVGGNHAPARHDGIAREEMDIRYFGLLLRLAQHFGPTMRARGADGVNAASRVRQSAVSPRIDELAVNTGHFQPPRPRVLSAAQALRAELRPGGVKVLNMFAGTARYRVVPVRAPAETRPRVHWRRRPWMPCVRGIEDVLHR